MERRVRCPCRRSPDTAEAGGGYGLPGIACPTFTAVEPTAQVRLRTPLLSLAGQEAFGRATADQRAYRTEPQHVCTDLHPIRVV